MSTKMKRRMLAPSVIVILRTEATKKPLCMRQLIPKDHHETNHRQHTNQRHV
jgi:hypothetical protein